MSSELTGGQEAARPAERADSGRFEMAPEQAQAYSERVMQAMDRAREQERAKDLAAAEARGLKREQWFEYEGLRRVDGQHAGQLEEARYRLREGPPDKYGHFQRTTDEEKQEFWDKWRGQENRALEHFRAEPVEGSDNKPIDPERIRPRVHWAEGDPPIDPGDVDRRDVVLYERPERRDEQNPRSGLDGTVSALDSRLAPEEVTERIEQGKARAREAMGLPEGKAWDNSKYAGEVLRDKLPPSLRERFPEGVQFSDEGFPQFDRYAAKSVVFAEGFRGPDREDDFRRANAIFGWSRTPENMVWHHKEDGVGLVLIDKKLHNKVAHWGGVRVAKTQGLWEGTDQ